MAHLPLEDKMEYTKLFLKVDHEHGNGDGALSLAEFEKLMIVCGHKLSREEIGTAFVNTDKDANWKITLDEFLAILPKLVAVNSAEYIAAKLRRVFEFYDKDNDGFVSLDDLQSVLTKGGVPFDETELNEQFAKSDKNADGKLNFEEFITMFVNKEVDADSKETTVPASEAS